MDINLFNIQNGKGKRSHQSILNGIKFETQNRKQVDRSVTVNKLTFRFEILTRISPVVI